jgi:hypothetical protein
MLEISSLYDCALQAVLKDLSVYEGEFPYLPSGVKTSLARAMAKRGILTDRNIRLVGCVYQIPIREMDHATYTLFPHCVCVIGPS